MITLEKMKSLPKDNFPEYIVVHHSAASADQTFKSIQDYHISLGWENIGYHWCITKDGTIIAGRPEHYHGAHVAEQNINKCSIGICLIGDFNKTKPTLEQENALRGLLAPLMARYTAITPDKIVPHRYFLGNPPYKNCYGNLPDDWARNLLILKPSKEEIKKQITDLLAKL